MRTLDDSNANVWPWRGGGGGGGGGDNICEAGSRRSSSHRGAYSSYALTANPVHDGASEL